MGTFHICSIENCDKPVSALGYCSAHYQRQRRHGDPLGGRVPNGEAIHYLENIVLPHNGADCLLWPYTQNAYGYAVTWIDGSLRVVSRYVCEKVHGAPPSLKHEAAHSCGKGSSGCVNSGHLSWKTPTGNQADRIAHGTDNRGAKHGMSKLTAAQVLNIRVLAASHSQREIGKMFGISQQTVSDIVRGKLWGHVS